MLDRLMQRQVGSSPRMRGTPGELAGRETKHGIIPAYAGNTHPARGPRYGQGDHPRVCGEHSKS